MRVLFSAGEVSGDVVGALLAKEISARRENVSLYGLGGPRMAEAGVDLLRDTNAFGSVGVSEALRVAPGLLRAFAALRRRVLASPPDVAVLIANDIFNVLLGRWLKRRGVKTVSLFPPQVWIWRSLAPLFVKSFDEVLACFPEEESAWREAGGSTTFVGHYLADALHAVTPDERDAARRRFGLDAGARVVAVLPGSRRLEVSRLLPELLGAAARLRADDPSIRFLLPLAAPFLAETLVREIRRAGLDGAVRRCDDSLAAMRAADLVLLASGTASLEAMLLGVPMVISYRVSKVTIAVVRTAIALKLIDSDTVGLPNLILGRRAVPELIQDRVSGPAIADEARRLLRERDREAALRRDLAEASGRLLAGGSLARAAEAVLGLAQGRHAAAPSHSAPSPLPVAEPAEERGGA
ncbi:MAG TPA: lipid-A-disaccharide synthase [Thermoanaerobaculia bacterium]|nr:lipid-A-disaccharide synthase [Thermoanaerobaculia bacterium]